MPIRPVTVTITITENYCDELKERLTKYDISQGELAREIGVDKSYFSRLFNRKMVPRNENMMKIEKGIVAIRRRRAGLKAAGRSPE